MGERQVIRMSVEELQARVASAAPPRPEDISPLNPGETIYDRLFTMCGHPPPTEDQLNAILGEV